ncbi:cupin domain-containing protein [Parasutterella secunda]|uniref:cupin domain-containing protein n=1 Tax=Parasutterella secunda TaxID=626947 RepID=UPI0025A48B42|nr:cupin domain-containing protein [Parasutterella secunda]MDM8112699.1 cupin domain-containing protein [Parasutterella secunda]MDM8218416.1 cupin domain-containing protein [Parasutterella secunda]
MKNAKLQHVDMTASRTELHELLSLTGTEVSINNLPAGVSIPFVHAHTNNEELYIVLSGKGSFFVDGEEFLISEGDCLRVDPRGERCLKAADDSALRYLCIQSRAGSLQGYTMSDGIISEEFKKPSWLK